MSTENRTAGPPLLLVVYDFPPFVGGGAVVRMVKLAKHLHRLGHPVTVVTGGFESRNADPGILDELEGIPVRVAAPHPVTASVTDHTHRPRWLRLGGAILRSVLPFPDNRFRYLPAFLRTISEQVDIMKPALVLITSPPNSMGLLVPLLKRRFPRLPVVLDYRDMWALDPVMTPHTRWFRWTQHLLERWTIRQADALVTVTPAFAAWFDGRLPAGRRSIVITNGYDEEDYGFTPDTPDPAKLTFGYAGTTGGVSGPLVFDALFAAFDRLLEERPALLDTLEIRIIGAISPELLALQARYKVGACLRLEGFLTHREVQRRLSGCDALLNNLHYLPNSGRIYPGKTFEYLRLGRPMLATAPEGVLRQLVRSTRTGEECEGNDPAAILPALRRLVDRCRTPGAYDTGNPAVYEPFERGALAARYRQVLMECIERRPFGVTHPRS